MRNLLKAGAVLVILAAGLAGGAVHAQTPVPPIGPGYPRPAVSPYINLARGGRNAAFNYFGIVRPQNQFYNSIGGLQQQVGSLDAQLSGASQGGQVPLRTTGHPVQFMNFSHYFPQAGQGTGQPARQGR